MTSTVRRYQPGPPSRYGEKLAARQAHEERRLDRGLGDLLVEEIERLLVAVQRHLDAEPRIDSQPDLPPCEPHGIRVGIDVGPDPRHASADSELSGGGCRDEKHRGAQERSDGHSPKNRAHVNLSGRGGRNFSRYEAQPPEA